MPIYEYQCGSCGHRLEVIQKMSEDPLLDCPECGQPSLQKMISAAGFHLKGSGWYVTDFKDSGKKKSSGGAETSSTTSTASEGKSGEKDKSSGGGNEAA